MSGGLTNFGAGQILKLILRAQSPTYPATMYMRLLTTPSSKGSSGVESSYSGYARIPIVRGTAIFTDPLLTASSINVDELDGGLATSADSPIAGFDFVNTASGAFTETYLYGLCTPQRSIIPGKRVKFPPGALTVTA
jgi:hypothetical protein